MNEFTLDARNLVPVLHYDGTPITARFIKKEIADTLSISLETVRTHVSNILAKLQLANRTQAALYALREGIAKLNDE